MSLIRWILSRISDYLIPIGKVEQIRFSKHWYEDHYYSNSDSINLTQCLGKREKDGYKNRFIEVIDQVKIPKEKKLKWLEPACNKGKTVFWASELFSNAEFYMFDFNKVIIEWVKKFNPIPERTHIWLGDIQEIHFNNNYYSNFFDIITCIDVTEHLPRKIYLNGIKEMFRVLRIGGYLILMQGNALLPEHINVMPDKLLVLDFLMAGFHLIKNLPHRHYLLKKDSNNLKKRLRRRINLSINTILSNFLQKTLLLFYLFFNKLNLEQLSQMVSYLSTFNDSNS